MRTLTRSGTPSLSDIKDWWLSEDGSAHWKQLQERHGVRLGAQLGKGRIPKVQAKCWACGHKPGKGYSYASKGSGLERCHVEPLALGGSNHPSNFVIMCKQCHLDSPDSENPETFWRWFSGVRGEWESRLVAAATEHGSDVCMAELLRAYDAAHSYYGGENRDLPMLVGHKLSRGWTISIIRKHAQLLAKQGEVTAARRKAIGKALLKAHDAAEKAIQDMTWSLCGLGFTPKVITSIRESTDALYSHGPLVVEDFLEMLKSHEVEFDYYVISDIVLRSWFHSAEEEQEPRAGVEFRYELLLRERTRLRKLSEDLERLVPRAAQIFERYPRGELERLHQNIHHCEFTLMRVEVDLGRLEDAVGLR